MIPPAIRVVPLLLALAAAILPGGCDQSAPAPAQRAPDVGVITLAFQHATLTTELAGRTVPYKTSDVRPQVSGILKAILFREGGNVKAGQTLYQIDPAPYQAALDSARAQLAGAEANAVTAKLKATRYGKLIASHAIGRQAFDDAIAASKQADAAVEQQKASVESAQINLDYTRITAPISGRIGRSAFTEGALVTADQPAALATIQTLDPIYVDINQSSSELLRLEQAVSAGKLSRASDLTAPVTLTLDDGSNYGRRGRLEFSEVTVDPNTGAVALRAIFSNPQGVLLPGMFVRARVIEGVTDRAILAPQQGVNRDQKGEPTALIVDGRGIARLRNLSVGQAIDGNWLVTQGLAPGDRLIIEGTQKAEPDMPVHAVPAGPHATARS
jgi:membrane fusion protein (multidrug efflux system)